MLSTLPANALPDQPVEGEGGESVDSSMQRLLVTIPAEGEPTAVRVDLRNVQGAGLFQIAGERNPLCLEFRLEEGGPLATHEGFERDLPCAELSLDIDEIDLHFTLASKSEARIGSLDGIRGRDAHPLVQRLIASSEFSSRDRKGE